MTEEKKPEIPVEISEEMLSSQALDGIIENFVLREGTDYGLSEVSYESKARQVKDQLKSKKIRIVFDQASETVTLMTDQDFRRLHSNF
jgi:hypothetical protein